MIANWDLQVNKFVFKEVRKVAGHVQDPFDSVFSKGWEVGRDRRVPEV